VKKIAQKAKRSAIFRFFVVAKIYTLVEVI